MTQSAKFRVQQDREMTGEPAMWMVTENGRDTFTARWQQRKAAQTALDNARAAAARIAGHGYHQDPDPYKVYVFVDRTRVNIDLPYEAVIGTTRGTVRTNAIKAEIIRHILDRVKV